MSEPTAYGGFAHRNTANRATDERTDRIRRFRSSLGWGTLVRGGIGATTVGSVSDVPPPPNIEPPPSSTPPPPPPPPPGLTPPPGYAAYDGNPTPTAGVKRVRGLAIPVVVSVSIAALTGLLAAILSTSIGTDASDFLAGSISESEFEDALVPLNSVQLLGSVATLATGVLSIIWAFRIAQNVRSFGRATTWSPLFAIFGWFLPPLVLYVIPFLVLRELWKASEPTGVDGSDAWKRTPDNPVLWVWFVLFGLAPAVLFAVQIGSFASSGLPAGDLESVAESLEDFGALGWATAVLNVGAAAAWITFVRQLTRRHKQLTNEA